MPQQLIGVYQVDPEPWVLVELAFDHIEAPLDINDFALIDPTVSRDYWQVPYDERVLDPAGTSQLADDAAIAANPSVMIGAFRLCFFLFLDPPVPLRTPLGEVELGRPKPMPDRLGFIAFEEP